MLKSVGGYAANESMDEGENGCSTEPREWIVRRRRLRGSAERIPEGAPPRRVRSVPEVRVGLTLRGHSCFLKVRYLLLFSGLKYFLKVLDN